MECFRRNTRLLAWRPARAGLRRSRARVRQGRATGQREKAPRSDPRPGSSQLSRAAALDLRAIRDPLTHALPGWEYLLELWSARDQESRPSLYSGARLRK